MTRSVIGRKAMGTDLNAPVAGAYMAIPLFFERADGGAGVTDTIVVNLDDVLPPGMKVRILGASLGAGALAVGTVTVDVGTSGDPNAYIAGLSLAAAGSAYQKCNGVDAANAVVGDAEFNPAAVAPADTLRATITLAAAVTFDGLQALLWVIPTAQDTDIAIRA